MKKPIALFLIITSTGFACGPWFPPSYISDLDSHFIENINVPMELLLLARDYQLIDGTIFPSNNTPTAQADLAEFTARATELGRGSAIRPYAEYAQTVRGGNGDAPPPELPDSLREFTLYLEGYREMQADPELTTPQAWNRLLAMAETNRTHRTTWVYYMLGNLAASHGQPTGASQHYAACRRAQQNGFADSLGLAHATFKREFLAQTGANERIRCGVQAIAYYQLSKDWKNLTHCLDHLKSESFLADGVFDDPVRLEAAALFLSSNYSPASIEFVQRLEQAPALKITSRLAWFMYKRGEIERAEAYLASCPADDILAIWLRFRIAQRSGKQNVAVAQLRRWLEELQQSTRIAYEFEYHGSVTREAGAYGNLGNLLVTQGHMQDAIVCFVKAGAYQDAALIAERYLDTGTLKAYVDTFAHRPTDSAEGKYYESYKLESPPEYIERHLAYLLARRLFRENRPLEALPYYPPKLAGIAQTYLDARAKAGNIWTHPNTRAAHLFHAARIMRWKGMELCGTELAPDYRITNGSFDWSGVREKIATPSTIPSIYAETAPSPDLRFHYRYRAAELAGQAARLAWNRHQRAAILWTAGSWIEKRDPKVADLYYKQLAQIRFQPLATAADELRWFPPATPMLDSVYRSEEYLSPEAISNAARDYARTNLSS
jgi:tetratricopeptide (TPR) repeat protein